MTPDRAEAAAVMLESLARDPGNVKLRAETACALLWIPNTHPLRWVEVEGRMTDLVLDEANAIQHGRGDRLPRTPVTADELRAFAGRLREGVPEMRATGWYKTLHGGGE